MKYFSFLFQQTRKSRVKDLRGVLEKKGTATFLKGQVYTKCLHKCGHIWDVRAARAISGNMYLCKYCVAGDAEEHHRSEQNIFMVPLLARLR